MKLRFFFILLGLLVALPCLLLVVLLWREGSILLYVVEGFLILISLFLHCFYKRVVRPLDTIAEGMDLLAAQDYSSRLAPVGQKEADRIVELFNRLMVQVKNERLLLLEQENLLSQIINVSPMGVVLLDFENKITLLNPSARRFLAPEGNVEGSSLSSIETPLAVAASQMNIGEERIVRQNGVEIYRCLCLAFMHKGFSRPFIIIEPLADEIHKAEKSAYEKVIRMIAHEVNNSVAGVMSALGAVNDALSSITVDTLADDIADIKNVIKVCEERGYNMSRFITNFANVVKIPAPQLREVDINECVAPCIGFSTHLCKERNISLEFNLTNVSVFVKADTTLFEQIMLNIIKNSVESIGHDGKITVETFSSPASIVVTDDGAGIDASNADSLFKPFFSTKADGQGLGLMFIREVLVGHGCSFSLKTDDDGLTRFKIFFKEELS